MTALQDLIPDEATIKIVSPKSDLFQMAPSHLKRYYWVALGDDKFITSFDTLEEAVRYIRDEALALQKD